MSLTRTSPAFRPRLATAVCRALWSATLCLLLGPGLQPRLARAELAETPAAEAPSPGALTDRLSTQESGRLHARYHLEATLSPDHSLLRGQLTITLRPDVPLNRLVFITFPDEVNLTRDEIPPLELARLFPGVVSNAGLQYRPTLDGAPVSLHPLELAGERPSALFQELILPQPGVPGEEITLTGDFELQIPHRYGSFGQALDQVTLAAGWLPLLASHDGESFVPRLLPDQATFSLRVLHPAGDTVLLNGQPLAEASAAPKALRGSRWSEGQTLGRIPSLIFGPLSPANLSQPRSKRRDPRGEATNLPPVLVFQKKHRVQEEADLRRVVRRSWEVWRALGLAGPAAVPLIQAPLRRTLAMSVEGAVLISDRALQITGAIQRFHEFPLAHALFQGWIEAALQDEPALWRRQLADGLAWELVSIFRAGLVAGALSPTDILGPLSFLPEVDQMLYAPRFAFAQELYDLPYATDPFREYLPDALLPAPSGRVLFLKLEDRFGKEILRQAAARRLIDRQGSFLACLAQTTGLEQAQLEGLVRDWLQPYPQVNYTLSQVHADRAGSGWKTRFVVGEEVLEGHPLQEPVTIQIKTAGETRRLVWDGEGQRTLEVETQEPVKRITLDPDRRLLETNAAGVILRDDNDWPARHKFLLAFMPASMDLALFKPQGVLAIYHTRPNSRRYLTLFEMHADAQVRLGLSLGLFRYFGAFRDSQWRVNRVGAELVAGSRLGDGFFRSIGDSAYLNTYGLRLTYRHESRQLLRDAIEGGYLLVALEGGEAFSPDSILPYSIVSLSGIKPIALHPRLVLVARGMLDAGFGLPAGGGQRGEGLFTLGGASVLRGLPGGTGVGNLRYLGSLEYRALLAQDLALNLRLFWLRGLQAATFVDVGGIGYALEDLKHPQVAFGVGLRIFLDWVGFRPGMLGIELAGMADDPTTLRPIVRFNQPF